MTDPIARLNAAGVVIVGKLHMLWGFRWPVHGQRGCSFLGVQIPL